MPPSEKSALKLLGKYLREVRTSQRSVSLVSETSYAEKLVSDQCQAATFSQS